MDSKPNPPEVPSGYAFHHETRWSRVYEHPAHGDHPRCFFRSSKFRTGEASIALRELQREWPAWNSEQRSDFLISFYSEDVGHSKEIFRFFISQATPESRYRYSQVFPVNRDSEEAFAILSSWLTDPQTLHRHCLLEGLLYISGDIGKGKAAESVRKLLDQQTSDGAFWSAVEDGSASLAQAELATTCLAFLGWMGHREEVLPILARIGKANLKFVSDHANRLVKYGKEGQWSL